VVAIEQRSLINVDKKKENEEKNEPLTRGAAGL
jgi:hypothetical protein